MGFPGKQSLTSGGHENALFQTCHRVARFSARVNSYFCCSSASRNPIHAAQRLPAVAIAGNRVHCGMCALQALYGA